METLNTDSALATTEHGQAIVVASYSYAVEHIALSYPEVISPPDGGTDQQASLGTII